MEEQTTQELLKKLIELQSTHPQTSAAEVIISVVPLLGVILGATLLFFFFLWNYRLKKELIRAGQYQYQSLKTVRIFTLLIGIISLSVGIPMSALFIAMEGASYSLLGGLIPSFVGLGLIIFYSVSRKRD
ncbi:MAG: hypothetical protein KDK37_04020 [Leptospiraceae bacterium]|nr:hypothetical protein [Leptospiraceae bacterium]MCB1303412.1 hypothetical protein [Leptospiraceae bacterium]